MSNDLNRCEFIGRLGKDVELKYMASGDAIANITLAVGESWKDKQTGQKQEKTEWVRISVFGKLAEICGQYLTKGSQVYFAGKLRTRKWQGQDGTDKYTTEIVVDGFDGRMQMLGGGNKPEGGRPQQRPQQQAAPQNNSPAEDFDDDIPF